MASIMRDASVVIGTYAEVMAETGFYTHQRAIVTDHNGAEMFWSGSTWLWLPRTQTVSLVRSDVTAQADTALNVLHQYVLPKLGTRDSMRVYGTLSCTNNANVKTLAVKLGSSGAMADGMTFDIASGGQVHFFTQMRNAGSASAQRWMSNNKNIWGVLSGAYSTTSKATGTAGLWLQVTMQKATGADSVVLATLDIELCGGGVA